MRWAYSSAPVRLLREPLVSPFSRRVLFVVAAAIRFATPGDRPLRISLPLMCSYCLLRLGLFTPRGGIAHLLAILRRAGRRSWRPASGSSVGAAVPLPVGWNAISGP